MFELLFSITEWLRETALLDFSFWLSETTVSVLMVENFWAVPIAQVVHLLAMAAAFGATLMVVLRVFGKAGADLPIAAVTARYVPWMWWGLFGLVASGVLMGTAEPLRNLINAVFWIKMILLVLMVAITLAWLGRLRAAATAGGAAWQGDSAARTSGIVLIALWCLIMACGRWIAYVPV